MTKKVTFEKKITKPKLKIKRDSHAESPRNWSTIGTFVTAGNSYVSPDGKDNIAYEAMQETEMKAEDGQHHASLIAEYIERETSKEVIGVYPVTKYEHTGIRYTRGTKSGWDYSHNGFYVVTESQRQKLGTPKDRIENVIDGELDTYTQWCNGNVYSYILYNENGNVEDSCGGFYEFEHMKDYLPDEFEGEDLRDYLNC